MNFLEKILKTYHSVNKPSEVEGFWDKMLIRPSGFIIAYFLQNSLITPNILSFLSLIAALGAALSYFQQTLYGSFWGLFFIILVSALDSADGQLARLRNSSTTFGAVIDGLCDNLAFAAIYISFYAAYVFHGGKHPFWIFGIAALAGLSHSIQSALVDFERKLFVYYIYGRRPQELEFPEKMKTQLSTPSNLFQKILSRLLLNYNNESRFFLRSSDKLQRLYESSTNQEWKKQFSVRYRDKALKILPWWTLMAPNSHKIGIIICAFISSTSTWGFIQAWGMGLFFLYDILLNIPLLFLILWQRKIDTEMMQGHL